MDKIYSWWYGEGEVAKATSSSPSLAQSINESMDTIDGLTTKRILLLKKAKGCDLEARKFKKENNMVRAMACMKQKQHYESQAQMYEGMILNMEKTSMALETTATSAQVAKTMKTGTQQMKNILKDVKIDDIDMIADDLDDSMRDALEVSNALARPMGSVDPEEDDKIMAEMAKWDSDEEEDELNLPSVGERKGNSQKGIYKIKE